MKKIAFLILIAMAMMIFAGESRSVIPYNPKEKLIQNSESVIYGKVISQNSYWSENKKGIFTDVKLRIQTQFKGEYMNSEITIQIPGGKVGEISQKVSDTPKFKPGSNVIVHLFTKENGRQWVYGWEKGVLEVRDDYITEYQMTTNQFDNLVKSLVN